MSVIVITGGIGAGKSTAAAFLASKGAVVLDVDAIAKAVVTMPGRVQDRIVEHFGPEVQGPDLRIDPAALASVAFASDEACDALDAIVHPAVLREVMTGLDEIELLSQPPRLIVLEVPLLVEAPAFAEIADSVVALTAPEETRIARCVAKGMDEADARARLARQATDVERASLADVVIENSGTPEEFEAKLEEFWEQGVG